MFETSQDLLFFVIATAIVVITALVAWVLVYIILMFKETRKTIQDLHDRMDRFFQAIDGLKLKFRSTASTLSLLVEEISRGFDLFRKIKASAGTAKNILKKRLKQNKKETSP